MDASIDFAQPLQSVDASIDSAIDPEVGGIPESDYSEREKMWRV
jgi:hypothetical protein